MELRITEAERSLVSDAVWVSLGLKMMRFGDPVSRALKHKISLSSMEEAEPVFVTRVPSDDMYASMSEVMRYVRVFAPSSE